MATIIRKDKRDFQPNPNKIDGFRLLTDNTRENMGIIPKWLNFDVRKLNPRECNAAYHFHRYAEELLSYNKEKPHYALPKVWKE